MRKLLIITLIMLTFSFAFARRDEEETTTLPTTNLESGYNYRGNLMEITDNQFNVDDQIMFFNSGSIAAEDSAGNPVMFSSIDPPVEVELMIEHREIDDQQSIFVTKIRLLRFFDDVGNTRESTNVVRTRNNNADGDSTSSNRKSHGAKNK